MEILKDNVDGNKDCGNNSSIVASSIYCINKGVPLC